MKTFPAALCLCLVACAGAHAGDRDFDLIVRSMESHYGARRLTIPFFGVVNFFVKTIRPAGARDIKLAVFENVDERRHPSDEHLDHMLKSLPAQSWSRFVRVQSNRNDERVHIYSRKVKDDWELLITTLERNETVLVRVRLNPGGLAKWVHAPAIMARHKRHDHER